MARAKAPRWRVAERARNVHEFRLTESLRQSGGDEAWVLWMSDEHWDHPKCRRDLLAEHHREAVARRALIVKVGDTFCAMQGRGDPRGDKGSVRPEHWGGDYLDRLVNTAVEWYEPWAANVGVIGLGNHETSVYKFHETCLIERLCAKLQDRGGIARKGGYSGWVRLMTPLFGGSRRQSRVVYYHHGFGGGGPVTKGAIDFNRYAEWVEADDIVAGHVHWKQHTPVERVRLTGRSEIVRDQRHYVRCGAYKDEFEDGHSGFHVEKGRGPRRLGGWWQRLYIRGNRLQVEWTETSQ